MSGQMQQLILRHKLRMDCCNLKHALCGCSRLVKDHGFNTGQFVNQVGALNKDALARRTAQSAKERKGYRYHQRTRAGYHQEEQAAVYP